MCLYDLLLEVHLLWDAVPSWRIQRDEVQLLERDLPALLEMLAPLLVLRGIDANRGKQSVSRTTKIFS